MLIIAGADCRLGRLVIEELIARGVPSDGIAVLAPTSPHRLEDLSARGICVRPVDHARPEALTSAVADADKLLLISPDKDGSVVAAAREAGVSELVFISFLHADTSGLLMAAEHRETELRIRETGLPFVFLRAGWFVEHYTDRLGMALVTGVLPGCASDGRISFVTRTDIAAAAAQVLTGSGHTGRTYELGGCAHTLTELAAEVSAQCGRHVVYGHFTPEEFATLFLEIGLPESVVCPLVDAEARAACGDLFTESTDLGRLIRRPTAALADVVTLTLL